MIYFQSLTRNDFELFLLPFCRTLKLRGEGDEREVFALKKARFHAKQVFAWVYQRHISEWDGMTDLSKPLREFLKENIEIYIPELQTKHRAIDGTHKFLWKMADQKTVESVIIPFQDRDYDPEDAEELESETSHSPKLNPTEYSPSQYAGDFDGGSSADLSSPMWKRLSVCISSQVGCAMGCKFCLTGIQGIDRNLETHEIVSQVLELRKIAPIRNIVFMGMGEPLHNFENVVKAIDIFLDDAGLNFSRRKVTVSTSGIVPQIVELGKRTPVQLAISLNGTTDEERTAIMPINKKWNIEALLQACRDYPLGPHRRVTFEYVMIKDFNDSIEDAARLVKLVRGIPNKINLIPFNEHPGVDYRRSTDASIESFQRFLLERDLTVTVRLSRGRDILAACGQLRSQFGTARGTDRHLDNNYRANP